MLKNPIEKSRVERLLPRLKGQDQRLADDISVLEICIDFAQVFLHIFGIVQPSKVLPDNSAAGFDIENREIRQNIVRPKLHNCPARSVLLVVPACIQLLLFGVVFTFSEFRKVNNRPERRI